MLVQLENSGDIPASVAVVGRRPDGEHGLTKVPLVALHDELMGAADEVDVVGRVELLDDVAAKQIPRPSRGHSPPLTVFWVGPEQVTHGTVVGDLLLAVDGANVVEGLDGGRQTAVHAEYGVVDDG